MNIYLAWTIAILYWIVWPICWLLYYLVCGLANVLLLVLRPIYAFLLILLQPFVFVGLAISHCCVWPFRFLARFETLYIYLGAGGVVGLLCGVILYFSQDFISVNLPTDREPPTRRSRKRASSPSLQETPVRGLTAKEHRKAWSDTHLKTINGPVMLPPKIFVQDSPSRNAARQGLVAQTIIHEEVDSDF